MIILHPIKSVTEMFVEDVKEYPVEWLKFLFVESPIGWVIGGVVSLMTFLTVSTILYWIG